jgi:uncharacterized membrane protein YdjX (TVP38/TMEM64 family)
VTVFFIIFTLGTAFSLPVTGVLSVASGVIFGHMTGFLVALLSSTLGGTVAMFTTRYIFQDLIRKRFAVQLEVINTGVEKEGPFYLFGLRMIPVIPFWTLNLLLGVTSMRVWVFMLATLLGMIPVMLILTFAGSQLGDIESFSLETIFTPRLILALILMASFPLLARGIVKLTRRYALEDRDQAP